jgi:hypothetical protein
MTKDELQSEIGFCIDGMKGNGFPINLNSLLFETIGDDCTYFNMLAHNITDKLLDDELTDDEIMTTINQFMKYVKENNIK